MLTSPFRFMSSVEAETPNGIYSWAKGLVEPLQRWRLPDLMGRDLTEDDKKVIRVSNGSYIHDSELGLPLDLTGLEGYVIRAKADGSGYELAPSTGGAWALHSAVTISTPVANIPFVNLGGSSEVMLVCHGVTMSALDVPIAQVSTDNGANWFITSGDYIRIPASGSVSNATNGASMWNANATAARTGTITIKALNVLGAPKVFAAQPSDSSPGGMFVADNGNDVDAVRLIGNVAANFTGGVVYCYKR